VYPAPFSSSFLKQGIRGKLEKNPEQPQDILIIPEARYMLSRLNFV